MGKKKKSKTLELGPLEHVYRRTRTMALVVLLSIAGILAVVVALAERFTGAGFPLADSPFRYGFLVVGGCLIPFAMFLRANLLNVNTVASRAGAVYKAAGGGADGSLRARALVIRLFFLGHVVPLFICETTAVLGVFSYLASGDRLPSLILPASGLVAALAHYPRRRVLTDLELRVGAEAK